MQKREQIVIDGRTIKYYHTGKKGKQTILFLPGLCADCRHWSKVIPYLKDSFEIYAFSLPLYGTTNALRERYNFQTLSDLLTKLITYFHIRKPILVGHSLGSIVAMLYCIQNPKKVASLINISSPLRSRNHRIPGLWKTAVQIAFRLQKNTEILSWLESKKEVLQALVQVLPRQKARILTNAVDILIKVPLKYLAICYHDIFTTSFEDMINRLSQVSIPKLYVYGTRDEALGKLNILDSYTRTAGSEIIPIDDDHFIATNQPKQLAKIITRFSTKPDVV